MKFFKRTLLTIPLLLSMGTVSASVNYSLMVNLRNGDCHKYEAQEKPKVKFTDSGVKVTSFTVTAEYEKEDFESFWFRMEDTGDTTAIQEIFDTTKEQNITIKYLDAQTVRVSANNEEGIVYLHNLNGLTVLSESLVDGSVVISLSNLPSGIYILSINNQSVKIYKK